MAAPFVELEVGERTVKVTNPDKVYFPARGETKLDLVRYFVSVGDGIVRALYERPCQLKRQPEGVGGEVIWQKRVPERRPEWIETARVTFPSGRHADELCVTEVAHVAWAANLATLEFGAWPSRRRDPERPDELRIDLDPQPGTGFAEAKRVAAVVREVLDEIGYVGWPKTSGNRGLHVYCRIEPNWEFPVVRRCALAFAREIERRAPELVTTAWWKEERGERVFVDYNQNARDRTILSAYSVRGRPDATVSAPVSWQELPDVETEDFTIASMPLRFAKLGDLHEGIDEAVCDLRVLLEWVEREEAEGAGEAPYPPNFPKMPGEPKRVQPSRAKKGEGSLALVPLGAEVLAALAAGRRDAAELLLGVSIPEGWPDEHDARFLALRAREAHERPAQEWGVCGLVLGGELVGHAGFHGPPGRNGPGYADAVEIGYKIFPAHRGRGYAQTAARALVAYARNRGVARVVASVAPDNEPSLAVVRKLGFVQTGEQWDDEDGRELVFELPLR